MFMMFQYQVWYVLYLGNGYLQNVQGNGQIIRIYLCRASALLIIAHLLIRVLNKCCQQRYLKYAYYIT